MDGARALCQQHEDEQAQIADQEIILDLAQDGLFGRRADLVRREILRPPFDAVVVDDVSSALIKAQHGQRRNQHRHGEQKRRGNPVERLHPQPEMQTDTAMNPSDSDDRIHQPRLQRPHDPVRKEHLRIEFFVSEQRLPEPHSDNMGDDQRRNAQAQHELQRLDRLPAKLPALIQRPDAERGVSHAGGIEHDPDRRELPEAGVPINAAGQRLHRDIAERMVDEMTDQISEQHQSGGQADLPHADPAGRPCQPVAKMGHAIHGRKIGDGGV